LHRTFGTADGIERLAFERVVVEFARRFGVTANATAAERIAQIEDTALASPATLAQAFSTVLGAALSRSPEHVTELEAQFRAATARTAGERFTPFPDAAPALRRLAAMQVPRVALSAGWPAIDQRKADGVGFDGSIVFAQDIGMSALLPTAFARVAERLSLPADRIWFVGSDARDEILPAAAAGLRTIWLNRDGAEFPAGRPAPDATIGSLAELFDVLSEPYTRGLLVLRHVLRTALDWRPGHFIASGDEATETQAEIDG
jgi:putative hydrolase of the HAD superfamily